MNVTQYVLIGLIVVLLIAYPILINSKNKKQAEQMQQQINSLKKGDKVLTTSGIYGVVVELKFTDSSKVVVLETGNDKSKGYISVDAYAIYTIINEDKATEEPKIESEKSAEIEQVNIEENKTEELLAEEKSDMDTIEKPAKKKTTNSSKKSSTTKKSTTSKPKKQS